jgi:DNA-binding MarR family transcriptional regulator
MSDKRIRDRPDVQVFTEIAIIDQLAGNRLERLLPPGLSLAQYGVLSHFARRGGEESPAQLAAAFQVTKGAMTNTLQRLEAQGFVRVVGDERDGRRKRVSITPEGLVAQDDALARLRPLLTQLRAAIPASEFEAALPFLSRLRSWLDQNR